MIDSDSTEKIILKSLATDVIKGSKLNPEYKIFGILISILTGVFYSHSFAITPDIVVAADGTGNFSTIQKAIDAVPSNSDRQTVIYIKRGIYNTEKLIVPADKKNISIISETDSLSSIIKIFIL